jgi:dTDP-L-rhamnose 4-epimerase
LTILVTGGAGFIGSHLVDALVAEGHRVRVLDSLDPQVHGEDADWPAHADRMAEYRRGDVRDREAVSAVLDGVEMIYHQAAAVGAAQSMYEIDAYVSANSLGAEVVLQEVVARKAQIARMVLASSMSIFGEGAYFDADGKPASPGLRPDAQLEKREWELRDERGPSCGRSARRRPSPCYRLRCTQ